MVVFHYREQNSDCNGVTIVSEMIDGKTYLAASRCSANDPFDKAKGRNIASGRIHAVRNGRYVPAVHIVPNFTSNDDFISFAKDYATKVASNKEFTGKPYRRK